MASDKKDVVDRLTDPKTYTKTHQNRFDETGQGKGKGGRTQQGPVHDASSLMRPDLHKSPTLPKASSGIDLSNVQKFGTQAAKARVITVFCNGDKNHKGIKITLTKALNSWDKLLNKCTSECKLPTGPCKKVYRVKYIKHASDDALPFKHSKVSDLEKLDDRGVYLCCGAEEIHKEKYPRAGITAALAAAELDSQ